MALALLKPKKIVSAAPSDEERRYAKMFGTWIADCKTYRKEVALHRQWNECWDMYMGRHFGPNVSYDGAPPLNFPTKVRVKINRLAAIIETILPILTDSRPDMQAHPVEPDDTDFAKCVSGVLEWVWEDQNMDMKMTEALKIALLKGTAFFKVFWDPYARSKRGDIRIDVIQPENLLLPRSCPTSDITDAQYQIHEMFPDPYTIEMKYGIKVPGGDGAVNFSQKPTSFSGTFTTPQGVSQTIRDTDAGSREWNKSNPTDKRPQEALYEVHFRDADYPDGGVGLYYNGRILPNPRTGELISDNPTPDGGCAFVKLVDKEVPGEPYGKSSAQDLLSPQKRLNMVASKLASHNKVAASAWLRLPTSSGIESDDILSEDGGILRASTRDELAELDFLAPPPLQGSVMQEIEILKDDMKVISGIQDSQSGAKPDAAASGRVVAQLIEAGNTRIRLQQRNFEHTIKGVGQICANLVLHNWSEKRFLRLLSQSDQTSFLQLQKQIERDDEGAEQGHYFEYASRSVPNTNNDAASEATRRSTLNPKVDIRIVAGSSLPINKSQMFNQVVELFNMHDDLGPLADRDEVNRRLDWYDGDAVKKRLTEKQKAMPPQPPPPNVRQNINTILDPSKIGPEQVIQINKALSGDGPDPFAGQGQSPAPAATPETPSPAPPPIPQAGSSTNG